jgi:hypothetical protein
MSANKSIKFFSIKTCATDMPVNASVKSATVSTVLHIKTNDLSEELDQVVGFVYGGSLMNDDMKVFFKCYIFDVAKHVRANMAPYYGNNIKVCYIRCDNADSVYNDILNSFDKVIDIFPEDEFPNIVRCSIHNAVDIMKDVSDTTSIHKFNLIDSILKPKV